ncbi:hypothetical protein HHK36_025915 [Tetracentron sinense]|uniref:Uncharacterized protein n=1 Tax=Tetracentron sinense TaxID=13715 RepID=A0A835D612_TETSI|nr:hypothetical protein HHK36_025915 [Tetracentron sinense]
MADVDVSLVADEISHLIFRVTNLIPGVENKLDSVLKGLRQMHHFLCDVDAKLEQNDEVKNWEDYSKAAQQVEDIINEFILKTIRKKGFWKKELFSWQDPRSPSKLHDQLKQMESKIHDISRRRGLAFEECIGGESSRQDIRGPVQKEEIKEQLITGVTRLCVISILGDEGMGKKSLAMEIYNSNDVKEHFQCCAWVNESEKILQEIAEQVKFYEFKPDTRNIREGELVQKLWEFLKTRKYLIVMADMWFTKVWDKLRVAFPDSDNGSRILFTTEDPECPIKVLRPLNEHESWELFTEKVSVPSKFSQLARVLVSACVGIPLVTVQFGALMSIMKADHDWVWEGMQELSNDWDRRFCIRALNAYWDLPLYLKHCFFYVVCFPENYEIPARRLIALWIAEGLVEVSKDGLSPEEVAETYIKKLIRRNLIQVAKQKIDEELVKTCRLPIALRQFWLSNAKEANFLLSRRKRKSMPSSSSSSPPRTDMIFRLFDNLDENHLHRNDTNPHDFQPYRYLYSLLSFDLRQGSKPGEDIENFFHRGITSTGRWFQLLRVLDLEGVFKPRLNRVLGKLINLRYLGLRWTFLDTLPPSIGNLKFLQTLDVKHTYVNNLPSSIWKLKHLRHLYLNNNRLEPVRGGTLLDLQTLRGVLVNKESQVKGGFDRSTDLRKLGLTCRSMSEDSQQEALAEWVRKLKNLRVLRLKSTDDLGQPSCLNLKSLLGLGVLSNIYLVGKLQKLFEDQFPPSVTRLTLSASELRDDSMPTLEKLLNLRILELFSGSYTGTRMVFSSKGFGQLRQLRLWKLHELKVWRVEVGAMPNIREIEIRFCNNLKMLPDGLQHLSTLQKLRLWKLEELEEWTVEKGAMPSIREIEIGFCNKLKMLPEDGLQHLSTLQKLKLTGMPKQFNAKVNKDHGHQDWFPPSYKAEYM